MPVNFNQIAANTAQVVLTGGTLGEDSITITYYPGRITDELLANMQQLSVMETDINAGISGVSGLNGALATIIKAWDVLDDDGAMFPLEVKRLKTLPIPFKVEVLFAIVGDLRPEAMAPHLNGHS